MEIQMSGRFLKKFEATADKGLVLGEVRSLLNALEQWRGEKTGKSHNIKNLTGQLRQQSRTRGFVLDEWKTSASGRIVFDSSSSHLRLIDFAATHTAVEELDRLKASELNGILESVDFPPEWVLKMWTRLNEPVDDGDLIRLLSKVPSSGVDRDLFIESHFDEWVRFLDSPQMKVRDEIARALSLSGDHAIHLILGGPGTGKTMVLLDLAHSFFLYSDAEPALLLPSGVRHYVKSLDPTVPGLGNENGSVVLLDDPLTFDAMEFHIDLAQGHNVPIVIAIDPTQWHKRRTIEKFHRFLASRKPAVYELRNGYRQSGGVGKPAVVLIENYLTRSSAFGKDERVEAEREMASQWEQLCLRDMAFPDQAGSFTVHEDPDNFLEEVEAELESMQSFQNFRNWPKTLLAWDQRGALPKGVRGILSAVKERHPDFRFKVRAFDQVEEVRGTEHDSALLFIRENRWQTLKVGQRAAGTDDWEALAQILTFLSRAENRLSIFVVPQLTASEPLKAKLASE
jgi:hypothetical protein